MKSIALILLGALLLMVFIPISSAETAESSGALDWQELLINILLTLVIWRVIMTLIKVLRRPKKSSRKKYRKKRRPQDDENPVLFDE